MPRQPHNDLPALRDKDQLCVMWPNGHGYDIYELDNNVAPPRFRLFEKWEFTHDGNVEEHR